MATHHVSVRPGIAGAEGAHRGQAILERFNRSLAERLFGHQYAQETRFVGTAKEDQRSSELVVLLSAVVSALNNEVARLSGKKSRDANKAKTAVQNGCWLICWYRGAKASFQCWRAIPLPIW